MSSNVTPKKITMADKCMLAVSNFGVYGCIASFVLHGPVLYTTYLGGSPQAIGTIGVIMGFFNAINGLPIAHLADKGYLNKLCKCFPIESCGRRVPWIAFGVPITALAGLFMWAPPVYGDGPAAIATWYAVIYFVLSCGFTAALQSMMAAVQELMPDAKSISQQTALGQPINLMAYTITGLVFPSIAFTQAPDDATIDNNCCIQPLQRCELSDNKVLPCACFVNNDNSNNNNTIIYKKNYDPLLISKCKPAFDDNNAKSASLGFNSSNCNVLDDVSSTNNGLTSSSSQVQNFTLCGIILFFMTLVSLIAIIPSRKSRLVLINRKKEEDDDNNASSVINNKNKNNVNDDEKTAGIETKNGLLDSIKVTCGMNSFRWTAIANLFANVNEQLTVQLLPFYLIYCVGVDFRDVGSAYTMVAGGQVGAALVSVPFFVYLLSLEKNMETTDCVKVKVPKIHPTTIMMIAATIKLLIQLPLTILAAVNHDVVLLTIAAIAGGTSTGGQPQVTQALMGWVMDDDETQNDGIRREGTIIASNAAVQHMSFVIISFILAMWGAAGMDVNKCPMENPQGARDAILFTFTWLNAVFLLIYIVALYFYPIKNDKLIEVIKTVTVRNSNKNIAGE